MIKQIYRFLSPKFQNVFLEYKVNFKPRFGHGKQPAHPELYNIVDRNRQAYAEFLEQLLKYKEVYHSIKQSGDETDEEQPVWNNNFLPGLDIVVIYGVLRQLQPKRYIEVGSGNSTKVVRKAIRDGRLATKVTSIDPYPRESIDSLADSVIRQPIEDLKDYSVFEEMEKGDILFIDNSHRCLPNSDVTVCFLEILPRLKKGVVVHVHDIYIPYDYPQFMCDRAYSEQYILSAFLLANPAKYKPFMPNYFISEDKELSKILAPVWKGGSLKSVERHGGSFWFEIMD